MSSEPADNELCDLACEPCRGGTQPLRGAALADFSRRLGGDWRVVEDHHLERELVFPDFAQALASTNIVGAIAEDMGHHPDLHLGWGKLKIVIWTHAIDGLADADFVFAARVDRALG